MEDQRHDDNIIVAANADVSTTSARSGDRPAAEPYGLSGGGDEQEPISNKRKLEADNIQQQGDDAGVVDIESAQTLKHDNINDSPPPAKRGKTDDGPNDESSTPQLVSRQCPKCLKMLEFRSERALAGGFKMHINRCLQNKMKESTFAQNQNENVPDENTHAESPSTYLYSVIKNPAIPNKDLNVLKKRKLLIKSPDPRPCFGCTWCGPYKEQCDDNGKEILCPICKLLEDKGWFRWVNESAAKIIFLDENKKRHSSVRAFLSDSTRLVGKKIKQMSDEEYSALFAKMYAIEELGDGRAIISGRKKSPIKPPTVQRPKRDQKSEDESKSSVEGLSLADFAKTLKSKLKETESLGTESVVFFQRGKQTIEKRREYVTYPDPRPHWGCEWCGVAKPADSVHCELEERKLCPICWSLCSHGWSMTPYMTSRSYLGPGKKLRGVREFIVASTDIVTKVMKSMSDTDRAVLQAKYEDVTLSAKKPLAKKPSRSNGVNRSNSGLSEPKSDGGVTDNEILGRAEIPVSIELPTISELLNEKRGLAGVLQADVFQVYNSHFGTNANIAAKILMCLGEGQLPSSMSKETPFFRTSEEIKKLSGPSVTPSNFVGVFRVKKALSDGKDETVSFGVAMPQFYVNCDWSSKIERTRNSFIVPKVATVNGRPLLLRMGIDDENVAGKLFSFCYRVMYGADAVSDILAERNTQSKSPTHDSNDVALVGELDSSCYKPSPRSFGMTSPHLLPLSNTTM